MVSLQFNRITLVTVAISALVGGLIVGAFVTNQILPTKIQTTYGSTATTVSTGTTVVTNVITTIVTTNITTTTSNFLTQQVFSNKNLTIPGSNGFPYVVYSFTAQYAGYVEMTGSTNSSHSFMVGVNYSLPFGHGGSVYFTAQNSGSSLTPFEGVLAIPSGNIQVVILNSYQPPQNVTVVRLSAIFYYLKSAGGD